ncbi:MAG: hypothetical protein WA058_02580 [Minisyncoccia bacterium]
MPERLQLVALDDVHERVVPVLREMVIEAGERVAVIGAIAHVGFTAVNTVFEQEKETEPV